MISRVFIPWNGRPHNMRIKLLKIYVAKETGWLLGYIGKLRASQFLGIVEELQYLERLHDYTQAMPTALLLAMSASDKLHHHSPSEYIGDLPKRTKGVTFTMVDKIEEPVKLVLGDGNEYELAVLNANVMEQIEEEYDRDWDELVTRMRAKVLKSLFLYLLLPKYPDMTKEKVGKLLTAKAMTQAYEAISKAV